MKRSDQYETNAILYFILWALTHGWTSVFFGIYGIAKIGLSIWSSCQEERDDRY
jgi:hypothetical protein